MNEQTLTIEESVIIDDYKNAELEKIAAHKTLLDYQRSIGYGIRDSTDDELKKLTALRKSYEESSDKFRRLLINNSQACEDIENVLNHINDIETKPDNKVLNWVSSKIQNFAHYLSIMSVKIKYANSTVPESLMMLINDEERFHRYMNGLIDHPDGIYIHGCRKKTI